MAQCDVHRHELLELEPVDALEAEQAVLTLAALRRAVERQVLRLALEVRDLRDAELVGLLLRQAHLVRAGERRGRQRRDLLLREVRLGLLVRLLRVLRDLVRRHAEERAERGPRVLGVGADLAGLERLQGGLLVAEVQLRVDRVAGRRQPLGVDLTEHLLLGEVLGADRELVLLVVRVGLDRGRRLTRVSVAAAPVRRPRRRRRRTRRTRRGRQQQRAGTAGESLLMWSLPFRIGVSCAVTRCRVRASARGRHGALNGAEG